MERPLQPGRVIGAGRGALIIAIAGAGWLGWGLSVAHAYDAVVAPIFGLVAISLWAWSIFAMLIGRALRRQVPASSLPEPRFPSRSFTILVDLEIAELTGINA